MRPEGGLRQRINLLQALEAARARIERAPEAGLDAPRPYKRLIRIGRSWIIEGRYWIANSRSSPLVISGVFDATADIPKRV